MSINLSRYLIFILSITVFSCFNEDETKTKNPLKVKDIRQNVIKYYYPSGKLKSFYTYQNDTLDGLYRKFFESGKVETEGNFENGVQEGLYKIYSPKGKLQQIGKIRKGVKSGEQKTYYPDGSLSSIKTFINYQGKEVLTGYLIYDQDGNIKEESGRIGINSKTDTISYGDIHTISLEYLHPSFDSTTFYFLPYDSLFYLPESISESDTIESISHKVKYTLESNKYGLNYLRGKAENFKVKNVSGDTVTYIKAIINFEYPYYVKYK